MNVLIGISCFCFVPQCYYLVAACFQYRCLRLVPHEDRAIRPVEVFAVGIPLFSIVWAFVAAERVFATCTEFLEDRGATPPIRERSLAYGHAAAGCFGFCQAVFLIGIWFRNIEEAVVCFAVLAALIAPVFGLIYAVYLHSTEFLLREHGAETPEEDAFD